MSQIVASRRSRLCLPGARPSRSFPGAIAVWRAAVRAGSPLRALRRFSAGPRECARKLSRAIKMPLMRHATLIVLWHVFLSQHFSCSDFCRARPLPAHKRAHIRMSAPSRRSRRTSKLKRKGQGKCASCADSRKPRTTLTERIETKPPVRHRPPRRTRPGLRRTPSDNGIYQKAVAQKRLPLLFSLPASHRKPAP